MFNSSVIVPLMFTKPVWNSSVATPAMPVFLMTNPPEPLKNVTNGVPEPTPIAMITSDAAMRIVSTPPESKSSKLRFPLKSVKFSSPMATAPPTPT